MKKITSILLLIFLSMPILHAYELSDIEKKELNFNINTCKNIKQTDIPTIFIPGILASWYSEEGYKENKIKRWIPDPITHVYDTLFYTFKTNGYSIKDVFYKDEFNTYIEGNPKHSLYLFGYDWKKDNKITAKLLRDLILKIRLKYEKENGCDIGTINIIAHSMGGLVARAMLEDMCANTDDIRKYYKNTKKGKIKYIKSNSCYNFTRINKFITISTPQRGSPGSFPLWEKGNLESTTAISQAMGLRTQLGTYIDSSLFSMIHGYNDKIPNGIITIGQLLPDIGKDGEYNNKLLYLEKKGQKLSKDNHPQNSFLEELNKKENIDKMFKNISGKFSLYYSEVIGNNEKNNIIGFQLDKFDSDRNIYLEGKDNTEIYEGEDIYYNYSKKIDDNIYNIEQIIRNDLLLGGDGTVPTQNLKLFSNDKDNNVEIKNNKFESIKVECFEEYVFQKENNISLMLGSFKGELCSHAKMPITTSLDVYKNIVNNDLEVNDNRVLKYSEDELKNLYGYIGYLDYILGNNIKINDIFNINYIKQFENNNKDKKSVDKFMKDRKNYNHRLGLKLGNAVLGLYRYEILSPINIIIEDEKGRKIGIDPDTGMIINEIPGAWTSGDTEGSGEPEFFIIPKTGTGEIRNKITSYPTGNGKYHIVMQDLKGYNNGILQEQNKIIIAGEAKIGIDEKYEVNITKNGGSYIKIDDNIEEKYKELLEKIYFVLDNKFDERKKEKLRNNLEKVISRGNEDNKYTYKVFYLVGKIFNYLNKNYE